MLPQTDSSLIPFFEPRGIVVFGASTNPAKLGYGIALNLVNIGYPGAIHFLNPKGGRLFDRPIYTDLSEVPDPVDLAVILVPSKAVPAVLEACGLRGIRAAIIASGGFREIGPPGAELEEACLAIARRHNMRLMGPNCIGLLDTHLPLDTTFLPPPSPPAGDIAFISHSGAICSTIVDWSRGQDFGFSHLISLGNQADVTESDVLAPVAADPNTSVITLYLESVSDGRRFVDVARQITPYKPILALKVGRTAAGQKAAASHTGALAGRETAFDAAIHRAGIQRVTTTEQLFDWARALAWCPVPNWESEIRNSELASHSALHTPHSAFRVAVLTDAGGPGVVAADALETNGLSLAPLAAETRERLRAMLDPNASVANPVDMLASASPLQYADSLRLLLDDDGVDAVLVILPAPPMYAAGAVARQMIPLIKTAEKPVVIALMGHGLVGEALAFFRAVKIPAYTFPEAAASALAALARHAAHLGQGQDEPTMPPGIDSGTVSGQLSAISGQQSQIWLPQSTLFEILSAYGISVPASKIVSSTAEAVTAAQEIGYPVALKIASPNITHKSDIGGVRLNLQNSDEVTAAFNDLAKIATDGPQILVQQMISGGQEVIVGVTQDPQFGPLLMFGSGGVEVEGLGDVAFALAPLSENEARRLLRETWAGKKLKGYRNIPPADETGTIDVILRLGQLAADFPQLAEIEINPLIVLEQGAVAVDGRARIE